MNLKFTLLATTFSFLENKLHTFAALGTGFGVMTWGSGSPVFETKMLIC